MKCYKNNNPKAVVNVNWKIVTTHRMGFLGGALTVCMEAVLRPIFKSMYACVKCLQVFT